MLEMPIVILLDEDLREQYRAQPVRALSHHRF